jgi:hypothetical protein
MQFSGGAFSYQTEPDSWCEPLNLVKKKNKPVAVVAPSSVVEKNNSEKEICKADAAEPVIKNCTGISKGDVGDNSGSALKLDSVSHPMGADNIRPTGMLEALLTRQDPKQLQRNTDLTENTYNTVKRNESEKDCGGDEKICSNVSNRTPVVEDVGGPPSPLSNFDSLRPDGLYSMIHSLASCEHKFLTALYMNSLMTAAAASPSSVMPPPVPGFGFLPGPSYSVSYENSTLAEACRSSLVGSNAPIMNNLLSFADTQHRLWQMVNWQQDGMGLSVGTDTCNTFVTSRMEPEIKKNMSPGHTASSIVIPMPPSMTSMPQSDGSLLLRKPRPNPKR